MTFRSRLGSGKISSWCSGQHMFSIGGRILCSTSRSSIASQNYTGIFSGFLLAALQRQPAAGVATAVAEAEDPEHDHRLPLLRLEGRLLRDPRHCHQTLAPLSCRWAQFSCWAAGDSDQVDDKRIFCRIFPPLLGGLFGIQRVLQSHLTGLDWQQCFRQASWAPSSL